MAGDWIKFECNTPDKPEVLAIAARMGWDDPDLVVGKLLRVWRWFDQHTEEGNAPGVTSALLDRIAGVTGFATAMQSVGWLEVDSYGVRLPNFDRHCGRTAKSRALGAKRAASFRSNADGNDESNAASVTSALPREEKRREDKEHTRKRAAPKKTAIPEDFGISDGVRAWAAEKGYSRLDEHLAAFVLTCKAKGYTYADWDSAFQGAIRKDWAGLNAPAKTPAVGSLGHFV